MSFLAYQEIAKNGLWRNNQALVAMLGLCPLLAVSNTVVNSLSLGLATTFALALSNSLISLIRKYARNEIRLPVFVLVIASNVTIIDLAMNAYFFDLHKILGIFVPLIVTNCAIMGRAEVFASKNSIGKSLADGIFTGLGFTLALVALGAFREIIGFGTILAKSDLLFGETARNWTILVFRDYQGFLLAVLPPGAFIGLGLIIAAKGVIDNPPAFVKDSASKMRKKLPSSAHSISNPLFPQTSRLIMPTNSDESKNRTKAPVFTGSNFHPRVSSRPIISLDMLGLDKKSCRTVLDAGQVKYTVNARTALALALQHENIGRGSSVLVPAYHCPAMVSPLEWLGVEPIFYPIRSDTTVDVEILSEYIRPDTKALIAVHYFGFIQDFSGLRQFCDQRNIVLIEDCAHAFFGFVDGRPPGVQGDYAIASIMKFLPVYEGGCLVSSRRSLSGIKSIQGGAFFQFKSALNILELSAQYGRLRWLSYILLAKDWLWQRIKRSGIDKHNPPDGMQGKWVATEYHFDPCELYRSMSWPSIAIMKGTSYSRACSRRREHYDRFTKAFTGIPGGHPLYRELPDGVFPQVFPMVMDEPEVVFPILKEKGVPIIRFGEFRWEGVGESTCSVSADLSRRVFQFPCHQSLYPSEIDWIIETVVSVITDSRYRNAHFE